MSEKEKQNQQKPPMPMGGPPIPVGGEKPKEFKKTFARLAKMLKPYLFVFAVMVIFTIGSTVFTVLAPNILGDAITQIRLFEILGNWNYTALLNFVIKLIILYVLSSICMFVAHFVSSKMSQSVVYDLRKDINTKLDKLPISYFDKNSKGDILSRITNDVETISTSLQQSITQIISSVCSIVGILIIMFSENVKLTLISFISLPLFIIVTLLIAKIAQKQFTAQQLNLGILNGNIEEKYTGHRIEKLFSHENVSIAEFEKQNEKLRDAGMKAQFISGGIMPILNFINNLMYVAIVLVGAIIVSKSPNPTNIGLVVAFTMYTKNLAQPISQTANIASIIQSTIAAAERVFEILDEQEEVADSANPCSTNDITGQVKFDNVDFSYTKEVSLITDMNVNVPQGGMVAIVGPTGAGKTTLVNLLMRFYDVDKGVIMLDGKDIKDFRRSDLRKLYSMVLQDTWLFSGSIKDNISYGKPEATMDEIVDAAKKAHVHHFIKTLTHGYDTILSEDASNLSQGQKQLLTIARAICCDYKVLILDEATSSVDTRTESYIQNAMTKMMIGKTSFVIAHRLSTIKKADLILVMNKGSVIEQGTHKELLAKKGFYADLYNSQFTVKNNA